MRRFGRILLNTATVVSFALCVAMVAVWARSCRATDWYFYNLSKPSAGRWTGYAVASQQGTLFLAYSPFVFQTPEAVEHYARGWQAPGFLRLTRSPRAEELHALNQTFLNRRGFALNLEPQSTDRSEDGAYTHSYQFILLPDWFLVLVLGALPVCAITRRRRIRSRGARGRCPACGYDLRATPDRCPECGAIPTTTGKPAAQQPGAAGPQKR